VIEQLVEQIESRFGEVQAQMGDPAVLGDRRRMADAGREFRHLEPAAKLAEEWRRARSDVEGAEELLAEGDDARAAREMAQSRVRVDELDEEIRLAMVERDPNDDKNVIVEIRGGAGGEEAGPVGRRRLPDAHQVRRARGLRPRRSSRGRRVHVRVKGDGASRVFKFEGGTHRVQRVPATESQGRIHTSTATVAVLAEVEDVDVHIDENDLQIDRYRSGGPGGQSVNTTDSAVRITHKPTGIAVAMQDEKSQLQNREKAMRVLRARLYEAALAEQQAALSADRRSQVGTGERAEKIRTYNYAERRVTDHRIKLTTHSLEAVLEGDLFEFTAALQADENRRRLEAQASAPASA
jgi:peptide chain release factor 1